MSQYLLAAEADQIQDLLFRSSRLREVVGGSQLLTRFCTDAAPLLLRGQQADVVVADGGAFRILFDDPCRAVAFGAHLAELYRRCTGGRLTVAKPVLADDFRVGSEAAQRELREAKQRGDAPDAVLHLPYAAFCASCGIELATTHRRRHGDERPNYECAACYRKEQSRDEQRGVFLAAFQDAYAAARGEVAESIQLPHDADEVAACDPRRYVAYLVADGNGMGVLFSQCNRVQMEDLSKSLTATLRESLAHASQTLPKRLAERRRENEAESLPVLPLLLGGDDCFALMPAPWAVDFARRFCTEFEQRLGNHLADIGLSLGDAGPTISAAVVVCKSKYPYALAYRRAHELLRQAKRFARQHAVSALSFELVTGNDIPNRVESACAFRPTLGAYSCRQASDSVSLEVLTAQRLALASLPGKRRTELEGHFNDIPEDGANVADWEEQLSWILRRIGRNPGQREAVDAALKALGDGSSTAPAYWRQVELWQGHGLPDLLQMWDFAFDLERERTDYLREA